MALNKTRIPHIGEFTKVPLNLLFVIGICVLRWKPSEKPKLLQIMFILGLVFHILVDELGILLYLVFESLDTSLEKTAYIIYTTFAGNALVKVACCLYNMKILRQVLNKFEMYYPKTVQESEDYKLDEHLKSIRRYNVGLTIFHFSVTSMFNLFPLMQTLIFYNRSEERLFPYDLPYPIVYAFNSKTGWGYAFAYFTQCTGSYSASCAFLGFDLLLISCVHIINMNFKYLAKRIKDFKPTGTVNDMEELKYFITFHNHILESVELVNQIFNMSIFFNYLSTATMICLNGFQLAVGTECLHLIKFLSFLMSTLTQVYFISVFATDMMTLSSSISEAFMHHPWYNGHVQYRRAILMSIARAEKTVHLKASVFFSISMETFKSLVSVSYQFFTLIKSRFEEHQ